MTDTRVKTNTARILVAVAALSLLAAACGSDQPETAVAPETSFAATTTSAPSEQQAPATRDRLGLNIHATPAWGGRKTTIAAQTTSGGDKTKPGTGSPQMGHRPRRRSLKVAPASLLSPQKTPLLSPNRQPKMSRNPRSRFWSQNSDQTWIQHPDEPVPEPEPEPEQAHEDSEQHSPNQKRSLIQRKLLSTRRNRNRSKTWKKTSPYLSNPKKTWHRKDKRPNRKRRTTDTTDTSDDNTDTALAVMELAAELTAQAVVLWDAGQWQQPCALIEQVNTAVDGHIAELETAGQPLPQSPEWAYMVSVLAEWDAACLIELSADLEGSSFCSVASEPASASMCPHRSNQLRCRCVHSRTCSSRTAASANVRMGRHGERAGRMGRSLCRPTGSVGFTSGWDGPEVHLDTPAPSWERGTWDYETGGYLPMTGREPPKGCRRGLTGAPTTTDATSAVPNDVGIGLSSEPTRTAFSPTT